MVRMGEIISPVLTRCYRLTWRVTIVPGAQLLAYVPAAVMPTHPGSAADRRDYGGARTAAAAWLPGESGPFTQQGPTRLRQQAR